jgi:DNA polymerase III epsilon subunit-like protein
MFSKKNPVTIFQLCNAEGYLFHHNSGGDENNHAYGAHFSAAKGGTVLASDGMRLNRLSILPVIRQCPEKFSVHPHAPTSFISLDCETNGLWGKPYAVAMVVYRNGKPTESICLSCPIEGELDGWLVQNPHLVEVEGSEITTYAEMMRRAAEFYSHHATRNDDGEVVEAWGNPDHNTTPILFHCGLVVEGGFFRTLREMNLIGAFDAPMAPIEVADYLRSAGENPASVDSYCEKYSLPKAEGATHNPLYDAKQAATAYLHLITL